MGLKTGKQVVLEQLIADGTRHIFGNPGTTEQSIMDALQDYPQLKFILALHEGVAVCAADAYARATRRPAFVELHTAPGLGNGLGMIYNAARGHTPMVVYAGHVDTHGVIQEPVLSGDLVRMARPICKWSYEAQYADDVPQLLRRALKVAADPPQGPVFLSLPLDVLDQETDAVVAPTPYTRWRSRPERAAVQEAATMLAAAQRPMLVIGDGVSASQAQAEVAALAQLIGAPILGSGSTEANVLPGEPLWFGGLNGMNGAMTRDRVEGADLLLSVGAPEPAAVFPVPGGYLPVGTRVIEINTQTWELGKNHPVDLAIAADTKETLAELIEVMRTRYTPEQAQAARRRAEDLVASRRAEQDRLRQMDQQQRDQTPIATSRLMEELGAAIPADAAVFDESITSGGALERYYQPAPGRYFRGRGGGIGTGMPGAVGLQVAFPDRPVVAVVGDGSSMYTITALWTAAHHNLPVTWVICNNGTYRILKVNTQNYLGEAGANRKFVELDLVDPPIDYVGLARSFGAHGRRVERPEDLGDALREAIAYPGPALVDVVIDGSLPGRP